MTKEKIVEVLKAVQYGYYNVAMGSRDTALSYALRAIELNKELVEALQNLYDEQNGPPLQRERDKKAWEAAMKQTEAVLQKAREMG